MPSAVVPTDLTPVADRPKIDAARVPFIWGVGVECSFLPHIDVDQFEWTQHDRFWRDDLKMIREQLGVTTLRYALPWHKIEVDPGQFDWDMADERVSYLSELGFDVMMDVMHFGTPKWLPQAVGDPRFPESLERFAHALVSRYKGQINTWCPYNEPLLSALFSGDLGFWPPYARKWRGYMPVLSRIALATHRATAAVRSAQPEATVMLCDAFENYQTRNPKLDWEVQMRNARRFLLLDLLAGKVDERHPLHSWVTSFGMTELDLTFFRQQPQMPDLIGLDYYPHSDWQLDEKDDRIRQRRADTPQGVGVLARAVYDRYGLPMMVTETSADGPQISREVWLESMTEQIAEARRDGVPITGLIWWPVLDQIDWDGALRHRIGKLHKVGLFTLNRQKDGTLVRTPTQLVKTYRDLAAAGDGPVGKMTDVAPPSRPGDDLQEPPLFEEAGEWVHYAQTGAMPSFTRAKEANGHNGANGHGTNGNRIKRFADPAPGIAGEPVVMENMAATPATTSDRATDKYGILVFSHLRWGFVWQRPQQFLSRLAKKTPVLFVEEPFFDLHPGQEPRLDLHRVMPNVTVACPHCPPEMQSDVNLPNRLREWTREALRAVNGRGEFDRPVLWYYSPMDSAWSLGHFENRGVVYDCMDELNQFTGAPPSLVINEKRLMDAADVMFTGGKNLWESKSKVHPNVHFYGCGVEFEHFNAAADPHTTVPPDIDFMPRPIIGWFGVVDERVDYYLLAEVARLRPEWTFAMVGPVVKVDPNLLPHSPNLHWLGGRDYQQLPNYCKAFDVCMMCFAINKATEFINPTKALEYLATGKPVISTPVKDVVSQYTGIVDIVKNAEEFVAAVGRALHEPDPAKIAKGIELAKANGWEATVDNIRRNIADAIQDPAKRRSKDVQPLPDPEAGYFFKHTQGS